MAGASDGSSTLYEIKSALSSAKFVENAGYEGDYKKRINGNVPKGFTDTSKNIDETHRLFQAAMTETLEYWKDGNTEHTNSGNRTLKCCIVLINATINKMTAKMKRMSAK